MPPEPVVPPYTVAVELDPLHPTLQAFLRMGTQHNEGRQPGPEPARACLVDAGRNPDASRIDQAQNALPGHKRCARLGIACYHHPCHRRLELKVAMLLFDCGVFGSKAPQVLAGGIQ